MTRTRTISALVGALAVGGLLFAAAPASAAVAILPEQDDLYGVTDFLGETSEFQLVEFTPTDASASPVGVGNEVVDFEALGQAAYDVLRDTSWVTYAVYDGETTRFFLATIDVTTGVATTIGEILDQGSRVWANGVMVGTDGVLYAIDEETYDLYTLNPETAEATRVNLVGHFHAFAYDPLTDGFYGISHDDYNLYEIDVATGATSLVVAYGDFFPADTSDSHSMQFDSNGVLWFQTYSDLEESQVIATYTLGSDVLAEVVGMPNIEGTEIYVDPTILITRGIPAAAPAEPTLAATGSDAGPVVLFGGLLLAAGAALVLGRVASRRSAS